LHKISDSRAKLIPDDFSLMVKARMVRKAMINLNKKLQELTELMNDLNFVVNVAKCAVMIFGDKTKAEFRIVFDGQDISVVKHHKYLGIYIDDRLNFKRHVNEVRDNTVKTTNVLKYMAGIRWGGHPSTLGTIYKNLIRSKLDYGCSIYGVAPGRRLNTLD
jgi:hypothetical protein